MKQETQLQLSSATFCASKQQRINITVAYEGQVAKQTAYSRYKVEFFCILVNVQKNTREPFLPSDTQPSFDLSVKSKQSPQR